MISRRKEYVALQYSLTPKYRSALLREYFIGPQNVMTIIIVLGTIAIIVFHSIRFGKKIRKQMQPVLNAIEQIKNQNLEYEVLHSGINCCHEIVDV